jgi:hypothetical protein
MIFVLYRWLILAYIVNCFVENYKSNISSNSFTNVFLFCYKLTKTQQMQRDEQILILF